MSLDFLILYEHSAREYESLLLLQEELRRRGYSADIRQLLDRKKLGYFTWKKPKVLVSSCMYNDEAINSHVYNNVGKCDKIVNLHWEQMLSDTQEDEPWFNFDGNAKKCVQTCWGKTTQQRIIKNGVEEKNAPVTGAIMMDFLRPEFDGYYKTKEELCELHGLDPDKKLILYISSFAYASMDEYEIKELSEMAGTDFSDFAAVNRHSMYYTFLWFDQYLAANPDVQIVYRRHPSEWNSPVLNALSQRHPHFHVIFSDSVKQWIKAADNIFIWMSTSIAEVYFSGKNCHILRPVPIPHEFDPVIYEDAAFIDSYDSFANAADSTSYKGRFPIRSNIIENYFDHTETPAYKRTADLLEDIYKNPPRSTPFDASFKPHLNWLKFFALLGIHFMHAIKLNPAKFKKISPRFAEFAGRIYGYIDKAKVPKADIKSMRAKIQTFLK